MPAIIPVRTDSKVGLDTAILVNEARHLWNGSWDALFMLFKR